VCMSPDGQEKEGFMALKTSLQNSKVRKTERQRVFPMKRAMTEALQLRAEVPAKKKEEEKRKGRRKTKG